MGSRVELFARTRRDVRVEGVSIRELARRHQVARKTIRTALNTPVPPERQTPRRSSPRLELFKAASMRCSSRTRRRRGCSYAHQCIARPRLVGFYICQETYPLFGCLSLVRNAGVFALGASGIFRGWRCGCPSATVQHNPNHYGRDDEKCGD